MSGYILDDTTNKCMKCHDSCTSKCSNCRCINDTTYSLVDEVIGCPDCTYYIPNCGLCIN